MEGPVSLRSSSLHNIPAPWSMETHLTGPCGHVASPTQETVWHEWLWLTWESVPGLRSPSAKPTLFQTSSKSWYFMGFLGLCMRILCLRGFLHPVCFPYQCSRRIAGLSANLPQIKGTLCTCTYSSDFSWLPWWLHVCSSSTYPLQNKRTLPKMKGISKGISPLK